jgi:hypothetical protein
MGSGPARIRAIVRGALATGTARPEVWDAWDALAEAVEISAVEAGDEAVADGGHGGGALAARKKGDLPDRGTWADLGDGVGGAFDAHVEAAGHDDVENVSRVALAHEDFASAHRNRAKFLLQ